MDIAAAVGAERLREIMTELIAGAAAAVQRFGGTVDKFTGDGIMAVFGAPIALEDHAFRACLAATGIQDEAQRLAGAVADRDGVSLQLRVGLNSGQVIAGGIGSGALGYTAIGEQVGMGSWEISTIAGILDPTLTLGLLYGALAAKLVRAELTEALRLAQRIIDLAEGDAHKGNVIIGSPLVGATMLVGCARCYLGDRAGRAEVERAAMMVRAFDPTMRALMLYFKYTLVDNGVWLPDEAALLETAELLDIAERSGDNLTLACARYARGIALASHGGPHRDEALTLLAAVLDAALQERFTLVAATSVDFRFAEEKNRVGDLDGAIELPRAGVEEEYACGDMAYLAGGSATLLRALLRRGGPADLREAQAAIARLAAMPTEPGFILHDIWLLQIRAWEARARGDAAAYRDYRDRYRAMANSLDYEGHIAWASEIGVTA